LVAAGFLLLETVCLATGQASPTPDASSRQGPATAATAAPSPGSVSTSGIYAPVLDQQKRPITAGGFVDHGPVVFEDVAEKAGLTRWRHQMGTPQKKFILETVGSGVGLLDYDNDGWLDIYLVTGSTYDAMSAKAQPPHAALFHNNHDGTFTNVAEQAGVSNDRWGFGVAVGDYDNDGWPDIYVGNYGKNRLYHNNHDGTFTDVAEKAGVVLGNWSTGATFGDDGDGRLDLFVPATFATTSTIPRCRVRMSLPLPNVSFAASTLCVGPAGSRASATICFTTTATGPLPMSAKRPVSAIPMLTTG
jgi:hypothetical protein